MHNFIEAYHSKSTTTSSGMLHVCDHMVIVVANNHVYFGNTVALARLRHWKALNTKFKAILLNSKPNKVLFSLRHAQIFTHFERFRKQVWLCWNHSLAHSNAIIIPKPVYVVELWKIGIVRLWKKLMEQSNFQPSPSGHFFHIDWMEFELILNCFRSDAQSNSAFTVTAVGQESYFEGAGVFFGTFLVLLCHLETTNRELSFLEDANLLIISWILSTATCKIQMTNQNTFLNFSYKLVFIHNFSGKAIFLKYFA